MYSQTGISKRRKTTSTSHPNKKFCSVQIPSSPFTLLPPTHLHLCLAIMRPSTCTVREVVAKIARILLLILQYLPSMKSGCSQ